MIIHDQWAFEQTGPFYHSLDHRAEGTSARLQSLRHMFDFEPRTFLFSGLELLS